MARYTEAGALDASFGSGGKRYVHFGGTSDDAEEIALDPFGRAVIVGDDGGVDFAVARLTVDGNLDTTFDSDGLVKIDFGATTGEDGQSLAIQTDGRIVVVGRKGSDFAVARLSGGGTRNYALQDANFNTTAVTDATGKVLERYQYDAYGAVKVLNADWTADADGVQDVNQPHLWQGGALVTATGTYHFRRRDVSPTLGRPMSADPLGYPDGMSRYEWERSNTLIYVDPLGTQAAPGERRNGTWGAPAPTPQGELNNLITQAGLWNNTSPGWKLSLNKKTGNNQCAEQAAKLQAFLMMLPSTHWSVRMEGGSYGLLMKHHVVVLMPKKGNSMQPVVIDAYKGMTDGSGPLAPKVMTPAQFRQAYPKFCGCCTVHYIPERPKIERVPGPPIGTK